MQFMSKFFRGLAQCGAWACLDEFNRMELEVLSVVAQQLHALQSALRAGADKLLLDGRDLALQASCGVFVTQNPGYAGRTELPDNLKVGSGREAATRPTDRPRMYAMSSCGNEWCLCFLNRRAHCVLRCCRRCLQVLFRPIAMTAPDYQLIAEVMLFSEGFSQASWLAGKVVHLYKLASQQLSQQVRRHMGVAIVSGMMLHQYSGQGMQGTQ